MKKARVIFLLVSLVVSVSCVPTLIGGAFYNSSKTKEQRQVFMANYNNTNFERIKAGLPPLDLCTEKYNFDEGWAKDDPECKKRIEAYKAGDKNALDENSPIASPTPSPNIK